MDVLKDVGPLTTAELQYLRKRVRLKLGLRKANVHSHGTSPQRRDLLNDLADSFVAPKAP